MSRFELVDATHDEGGQFFAADTLRGGSYYAPDDFERASRAVMTLNGLKPTWFAATYGRGVFVDVRAMVAGRLYADAQIVDIQDLRDAAVNEAMRSAIGTLERRLHKHVALHG